MVEVICGDALEVLRTMPSNSVHCVVTSPPYWGLRDYQTGSWKGGDPACDHRDHSYGKGRGNGVWFDGGRPRELPDGRPIMGPECKCGARRIDQQIGLESTPEEWCARLVEVFREVRRVLRQDGTCWINCGDSYCSGTTAERKQGNGDCASWTTRNQGPRTAAVGDLKPKDLIGQPWLLAFALRADGWWLRSEIIWAKPNPMPESVTDRCTKSHEQVFLLTKRDRYFYDADAVREPNTELSIARYRNGTPRSHVKIQQGADGANFPDWQENGRNLRSVWTIATDPLPSIEVDGEKLNHFASYPIELARRCILAGTSAKGCCPACGAPLARVVETSYENPGNRTTNGDRSLSNREITAGFPVRLERRSETTGWHLTCSCPPADPIPCTVLDPFFGSGRTGLACEDLGRDCVGIELNPKSVAMAKAQIERAKARRMIGEVTDRTPVPTGQMQLGL